MAITFIMIIIMTMAIIAPTVSPEELARFPLTGSL